MLKLSDNAGKAVIWVILLAVLALAGAWHFVVQPARLGAMEKETVTSLEVLRNALGKYYSQKGLYPESLDALIPNYISKIPLSHPHPMEASPRVQIVSSGDGLDYGGGWAFDTNTESPTYGRVFVNAKGADSKGKSWISY